MCTNRCAPQRNKAKQNKYKQSQQKFKKILCSLNNFYLVCDKEHSNKHNRFLIVLHFIRSSILNLNAYGMLNINVFV